MRASWSVLVTHVKIMPVLTRKSFDRETYRDFVKYKLNQRHIWNLNPDIKSILMLYHRAWKWMKRFKRHGSKRKFTTTNERKHFGSFSGAYQNNLVKKTCWKKQEVRFKTWLDLRFCCCRNLNGKSTEKEKELKKSKGEKKEYRFFRKILVFHFLLFEIQVKLNPFSRDDLKVDISW